MTKIIMDIDVILTAPCSYQCDEERKREDTEREREKEERERERETVNLLREKVCNDKIMLIN